LLPRDLRGCLNDELRIVERDDGRGDSVHQDLGLKKIRGIEAAAREIDEHTRRNWSGQQAGCVDRIDYKNWAGSDESARRFRSGSELANAIVAKVGDVEIAVWICDDVPRKTHLCCKSVAAVSGKSRCAGAGDGGDLAGRVEAHDLLRP